MARFWPDWVGAGVTMIVQVSVHSQVPVPSDYNMVIISLVQDGKDTVTEKCMVISCRGCINSNNQYFFALMSTRAHTTLPFLSLPSTSMSIARPFRKSIATPACALGSGVQDINMPEFHSCLYMSTSHDLNLVSVKITMSLLCLMELNTPLLFARPALFWPLIPPQLKVLNLIAEM